MSVANHWLPHGGAEPRRSPSTNLAARLARTSPLAWHEPRRSPAFSPHQYHHRYPDRQAYGRPQYHVWYGVTTG
jgi:hypothetical protein